MKEAYEALVGVVLFILIAVVLNLAFESCAPSAGSKIVVEELGPITANHIRLKSF